MPSPHGFFGRSTHGVYIRSAHGFRDYGECPALTTCIGNIWPNLRCVVSGWSGGDYMEWSVINGTHVLEHYLCVTNYERWYWASAPSGYQASITLIRFFDHPNTWIVWLSTYCGCDPPGSDGTTDYVYKEDGSVYIPELECNSPNGLSCDFTGIAPDYYGLCPNPASGLGTVQVLT